MANEQQNLTPQNIASITWKNFELLKPEWLGDERIMAQVKLFVMDTADSSDSADASRALQILHKHLEKIPDLVNQRPDIFEEYMRLLSVLKACFLVMMSPNDVSTFMKENLLSTMEVLDFDITQKINDLFLVYYKFPDGQQEIAKTLVKAMETSEEYLGTVSLKLKGREHDEDPIVSNWIIDYNQYSVSLAGTTGGQVKRGGVERASYVTHSPNVRGLREDEKTILRRVLELYDWLKSFLPAAQIPRTAPYYRAEHVTVPIPRASSPSASQVRPPQIPRPQQTPPPPAAVKPQPPPANSQAQGLTPRELISEIRPSSAISEQRLATSKIPPTQSPIANRQSPKRVLPPPPRPPKLMPNLPSAGRVMTRAAMPPAPAVPPS